MSWICVSCSEQHADSLSIMGFGLCKVCQDKARLKRALEKAKITKLRFAKMKAGKK